MYYLGADAPTCPKDITYTSFGILKWKSHKEYLKTLKS